MTFRKTLFCISALGLLAAPAAFANPDGGGGAMSGGMGGSFGGAQQIDPVKRYQDGTTALNAKNYRAAQSAFRDVLSVKRNDANANYMMGLSLAGAEKVKDSRSYFERAVKANADFVSARGWLGYAYVKTGEAAKAAEQKIALAALKTKCASTCKDSADIDAAIKKIDDAAANPAAFLAPSAPKRAAEGPAAYFAAAELINKGRYAEALGELQDAALALGPHPDVLTYQGFANRKLGNFKLALSYYGAALKLEPNHRGANEYLGEYYVETGDMVRARAQLAKLEAICKFGCEQAYELRRWIDGKKT